jgi:4-amino-4-deoxy-L-arabinose transferase-like glycosyltransferase
MPKHLPQVQPIVLASAVLMTIVWLTVFEQAMHIPLSHDEHQFIAAGRLAADGLLPYRDFPSNHMPYLTLAYAAVFKLTDWSLLPARAVSALSAALAAGLVYALTAWFLREERRITRFLVSSAATLLLITNPIFRYTSGRAWNHDLPTLLTLIAVALFLRGDTGARPRAWILASGAMVGFAVGIRLTYLVALVPFLLTILLSRHPDRWRWRSVQIGSFSLGVVLASLPWLAFFAAAPRAFLFGNITYQTLNTDYRELLAHRVGETVLGKFVYFYHVLVDDPANLGLFLGFGIAATVAMITLWRRSWIS